MRRFVILLTGRQAAKLQPSVHTAADRSVRRVQAYSIFTIIVRHSFYICIRMFAVLICNCASACGVLTSVQAYQDAVHMLQISHVDLTCCKVIKVIMC